MSQQPGSISFVCNQGVTFDIPNGDPSTILTVFNKMNILSRTGLRINEIATHFIQEYRNLFGNGVIRLYSGFLYIYKYVVTTSYIDVTKDDIVVFSGPLPEFYNWVQNAKKEIPAGKIVRFTYRGGSGTKERLIKVTKSTPKFIRGWDLQKSKADKPAHRCYTYGNIVGDIEIIS